MTKNAKASRSKNDRAQALQLQELADQAQAKAAAVAAPVHVSVKQGDVQEAAEATTRGISNISRNKKYDHFLTSAAGDFLFQEVLDVLPDPRFRSLLESRIRGDLLFDIFRAMQRGGHLKAGKLDLEDVKLLGGFEGEPQVCQFSVIREQHQRNNELSNTLGRALRDDEKYKLTTEEQRKYVFQPVWFVNLPRGQVRNRTKELNEFRIRHPQRELNDWEMFMVLVEHFGLVKALSFGSRYYFINGNYFANDDRSKIVPVSGSPWFWDGRMEKYSVTRHGVGAAILLRKAWPISLDVDYEHFHEMAGDIVKVEEAEMQRLAREREQLTKQSVDDLFAGLDS